MLKPMKPVPDTEEILEAEVSHESIEPYPATFGTEMAQVEATPSVIPTSKSCDEFRAKQHARVDTKYRK